MGKIMVGKTSEILPGKMLKVSADGRDILVANMDGNYFAMDGLKLKNSNPTRKNMVTASRCFTPTTDSQSPC